MKIYNDEDKNDLASKLTEIECAKLNIPCYRYDANEDVEYFHETAQKIFDEIYDQLE
jgi:hypothetical protein